MPDLVEQGNETIVPLVDVASRQEKSLKHPEA